MAFGRRRRAAGRHLRAGLYQAGLARIPDAARDADGLTRLAPHTTLLDALPPVLWSILDVVTHGLLRTTPVVLDPSGAPAANDADLVDAMSRRDPDWDGDAVWRWLYERFVLVGNAFAVRRGDDPDAARIRPVTLALDQPARAATLRLGAADDPQLLPARLRVVDVATGRPGDVEYRDLIHLADCGWGGARRLAPSPLRAMRLDIALRAALYEQTGDRLRSKFQGQVVLEEDASMANEDQAAPLDPDEEARMQATLRIAKDEALIALLGAGQRPALLAPFHALDQAAPELHRLTAIEACRAYRVPPRYVYDYRTGLRTDRKIEDAAADLDLYTLDPRRRLIGSALTRGALPPRWRAQGYRVALPTPPAHGTFGDRAAALGAAVKEGILTPNEARARLGLGPHADGDRLYAPAGVPGAGA